MKSIITFCLGSDNFAEETIAETVPGENAELIRGIRVELVH